MLTVGSAHPTFLVEIFGDGETLEQILAGRELINTSQAKALAERFKLSPQIFLNS
jgi:antitoxin component HigA of HigAB toxin-antitoxin module